jgi:hypothetical protein
MPKESTMLALRSPATSGPGWPALDGGGLRFKRLQGVELVSH